MNQPLRTRRRHIAQVLAWLLTVLLVSMGVRAEEFQPDFVHRGLSPGPSQSVAQITAPATSRSLLGQDTQALMRQGFDDRAEVELIAIDQLVAQGRLREALHRSGLLAERYSNFALAHLLCGDLLQAEAGRLRHFADVPAAPGNAAQLAQSARLAALVNEGRQRLRAFAQAPAPGVKHAILVDTSRSRLYLFRRTASGSLQLEANDDITQGKLGTDQQRAGDMKTPLGIYFITREVGRRWLNATYGAGAMPLNHPNAWDRLLGRTGGGIWLHGVPPTSYARPPLDSDGCVVLSNPDIPSLMTRIEPGAAPVVITSRVQWLTPAQMAAQRARVRKLLVQAPALPGGPATTPRPELAEATVLYYQDEHKLLVVQYGGQQLPKPITHHDYWAKQDGQWRLFHAGVLS
ncbi:L,D-transpeptidase family protein [Thiomonas sp.]